MVLWHKEVFWEKRRGDDDVIDVPSTHPGLLVTYNAFSNAGKGKAPRNSGKVNIIKDFYCPITVNRADINESVWVRFVFGKKLFYIKLESSFCAQNRKLVFSLAINNIILAVNRWYIASHLTNTVPSIMAPSHRWLRTYSSSIATLAGCGSHFCTWGNSLRFLWSFSLREHSKLSITLLTLCVKSREHSVARGQVFLRRTVMKLYCSYRFVQATDNPRQKWWDKISYCE